MPNITVPPTQPRDVLFVSHANPEDNDFAQWLTLKLVSLGYHAWSDVTKLLGVKTSGVTSNRRSVSTP